MAHQLDDLRRVRVGAGGIVPARGKAPGPAGHGLVHAGLHLVHLPGGGGPALIQAHHVRPHLAVAQQGNHVAAHALAFHPVQIFPKGPPIDPDARLFFDAGNGLFHRLDGGLPVDIGVDGVPHIVFPIFAHPIAADGRIGIPALAPHKGGDALADIALAIRIQENGTIRVGMGVDEPRGYHHAGHVHGVFRLLDLPDGGDLVPSDPQIRLVGGLPCAIDHGGVFEHQGIHGKPSFLIYR